MRVLLVAYHPRDGAGTKYRLRLWGERLRRDGHQVRLALPTSSERAFRLYRDWSPAARAEYHVRVLANRVRAVWGAGGTDVAVLHLSDLPHWEYGAPFVAAALKRLCGRVLLDLDDLPVVRGETTVDPRRRRIAELADGLILGNDRLREHFPDRPAWRVPTCVEPREWTVPDRASRDAPPLIGWVGTSGSLRYVEGLAPVLADVCRRHGARVRVVCDREPDLPDVPVDFVPWTAEGEVRDLLPIEIGIAPLADGPVTRCKCGLKALQYMAAGAAVVASPVGALADIVEDGETGLLAQSAEDWAAALERLLADPGERLRLGAAGRRRVEERWSLAGHTATFESALRGIA